jgi:hypothetical protein
VPDHVYREGLEGFPGHLAAGRVLAKHSTFGGAWADMDIFSLEDAEEWLLKPAQAAAGRSELASRVDGVLQVSLQFAMVAVMADRERRREDEEHETRVQRLKEEQASGNDPAA